jgi:hypothetical protein
LNPPANSAQLLARERRLMIPAGYAALLGVVLFVASIVIQAGASGENLDTDAGLLAQYGEDGGRLLLARISYGLAWLCFTLPLYVLFIAARARADRVRPALVAFCFIGPVLLAIQGPLQAIGLKDAGEKFLDSEPAAEVAEASGSGEAAPDDAGAGGSAGAEKPQPAGGGEPAQAGGEGQGGEVTTTPTEETTPTTTEDEEVSDATEQRAEDQVDGSGLISFSRALLLPALLGLVTAMVYTSVWAMRTGLMTRFWASLGVALGVAVILLPFAQLALVIWFLALGVLLLGRWPRGTPPAWAAGAAVPWTRPGDEAGGAGGDALEGRGRDVSGDKPDAPGPPDASGQPDAPSSPDAPEGNGAGGENGSGGSPRKRKRRR